MGGAPPFVRAHGDELRGVLRGVLLSAQHLLRERFEKRVAWYVPTDTCSDTKSASSAINRHQVVTPSSRRPTDTASSGPRTSRRLVRYANIIKMKDFFVRFE